jgi:uncharacterized protein (DUF2141 family)
MKTIIALIIALFLFSMEGVLAREIVVKITGIDVRKQGNIIVFLFGEQGYPKDHEDALQSTTLKADQPNLEVQFDNVPEAFAVKVLHDEDESGSVTKNWTGIIPREGLGFSNKQKLGMFGPPAYKTSKLHLSDLSGPVSIQMIYP